MEEGGSVVAAKPSTESAGEDVELAQRDHAQTKARSAPSAFRGFKEVGDSPVDKTAAALVCLFLVLLAGILLRVHESLPFEDFAVTKLGTLLWLVALVLLICICAVRTGGSSDDDDKPKYEFRRLNGQYHQYQKSLSSLLETSAAPLPKEASKLLQQHRKKKEKTTSNSSKTQLVETIVREEIAKGSSAEDIERRLRPKVYVLRFHGDTMAREVEQLRNEISIVLAVASRHDEVVIVLTSYGGIVNGYALGAAQLGRVRAADIRLTVCVDTVAASGGYMMACVGSEILASPGAYVGSIGVVSYRPNIQKLLNKAEIDMHVLTSGQYKRTVDIVGEVTDEGVTKAKEELTAIHEAFKTHVAHYRPQLDMDRVSTGEAWLAVESLEKGLNLVDRLLTSDEYISECCSRYDVIELKRKKDPEGLAKVVDALGCSPLGALLPSSWRLSGPAPTPPPFATSPAWAVPSSVDKLHAL